MLRASCWSSLIVLLATCSSERPAADAGPADTGVRLEAGASDAAADSGPDAGAAKPDCLEAGCFSPIDPGHAIVDLLFVVDNSGSMGQEQSALRSEFPRLIEKLVRGDHDADGTADHVAVTDLHIGVVSSNLGADPGLAGCAGTGDDGLLRHAGNPGMDPSLDCAESYPTFLAFDDGTPAMLEQISRDFGCIASLGTAGCGFEQHLESALKSLWPADDPRLTFASSVGATITSGHGRRENDGFLRATPGARSTLGIVVVADEDDCSAGEPSIFDRRDVDAGNPLGEGSINLRCHRHAEKLLPLERYLFGLRNLGSARVVFAGIVGVPIDLVDTAARAQVDFRDARARDAYYDQLLADPRMQERPDPETTVDNEPTRLLPACTSARGRADPARRFVQLAKRFGDDALVQSICGDSFGPPLDRVVEQLVRGPE